MEKDEEKSIVDVLERIANSLGQSGRKNIKKVDSSTIKKVYLFAFLFWGALIFFMGLYKSSELGWITLLFPVITFTVNYTTAVDDEMNADQETIKSNILTFVFISSGIFSAWKNPKRKHLIDNGKFLRIVLLALMLLLFTMLDLWISKNNTILQMHINTVLHTMSLSLLAYSIVEYYVENYR